jgi:hypothetical protein
MKKWIYLLFILLCQRSFSDELHDDNYYNLESPEGITLYGDPDKYERENKILEALNQGPKKRKIFIEEELLVKSGFRRTGNVKFRETTGGEKGVSVIQAAARALFNFIPAQARPFFQEEDIPMKPFFEEEYDRLPKGYLYNFYSVLIKNELQNVSREIQIIMELEYKLQIEFCNGIVIKDWNMNYYTEENIRYFEGLIMALPETMETIRAIKERFRDIELPRIKSALERHNNPSELYLQARKNLSDIMK